MLEQLELVMTVVIRINNINVCCLKHRTEEIGLVCFNLKLGDYTELLLPCVHVFRVERPMK